MIDQNEAADAIAALIQDYLNSNEAPAALSGAQVSDFIVFVENKAGDFVCLQYKSDNFGQFVGALAREIAQAAVEHVNLMAAEPAGSSH